MVPAEGARLTVSGYITLLVTVPRVVRRMLLVWATLRRRYGAMALSGVKISELLMVNTTYIHLYQSASKQKLCYIDVIQECIIIREYWYRNTPVAPSRPGTNIWSLLTAESCNTRCPGLLLHRGCRNTEAACLVNLSCGDWIPRYREGSIWWTSQLQCCCLLIE